MTENKIMKMSNAQKQAKYKAKQREKGLVLKTVWIHKSQQVKFSELVENLQEPLK